MATPEELELEEKKLQLSDMQSKLAQCELEFTTLHNELNDFQHRYTDLIVRRMYKLDTIEQQIAEYLVASDPSSIDYRESLRAAKERISEEESAFQREKQRLRKNDFQPSDALKKLYREVARKIHPDLTTDEKERQRRSQLMAEINEAYEFGNEQKIQQILNEWQSDPENIQGEDIGSQLIKIIRKIAQARRRVLVIEKEMKLLKDTELCQLRDKVENNKEAGIDLLGRMADYLDTQIHERQEYLKFLQTGAKG